MTASPALAGAFAVLERCVADGLVPGAAAAVGTAGETLHRGHFGCAEITPQRRPLEDDALFDVASLTKVVATTTLLLRFVERGQLYLRQRVASLLPGFGAAGKDEVTLRHLLAHTSGLPAWKDLHSHGEDRAAVLAAICREPLERPADSAAVYSDLGFITLGAVLAEVGGEPLDVLAGREVFGPLGMAETQFCPTGAARGRCVATEVVPGRGGTLVGTVHDENAAAQAGVSGHAGLFATCRDLERFCRMWLGMGALEGVRYLSGASVAAATRDQTGIGQGRGLGWVLQPNPFAVPADLCSPRAYSHTGFTGTSLLLDPDLGVFAVLLTNRVHPSRGEGSAERVRAVRARFHNAVWAAVAR
jgi:CubicO group peptidase (beta-lactamase class C family)